MAPSAIAPTSLVSKFSALASPNGVSQSLEDIMASLGKLYSAPLPSLNRLRTDVLKARIPESSAAGASQ